MRQQDTNSPTTLYVATDGNFNAIGFPYNSESLAAAALHVRNRSNKNTTIIAEGATTGSTKFTFQAIDSASNNLFSIRDDGYITLSGSLVMTGSIIGSLSGTSSYSTQALSSSYALTASYVLNSISSSFSQTSNTASYVNPSIIKNDVYFAFLSLYGGDTPVADSSVWHYFNSGIAPTAGNTDTNNDYNFGFAVVLIGVTIDVYGNTTAGTNENITLELINTTQATTSSVGTFQSNGGSTTVTSHFTITGLNISVASSDYICWKVTNPVWTTNPVDTVYRVQAIFKRA
jgi:hypothetical protein